MSYIRRVPRWEGAQHLVLLKECCPLLLVCSPPGHSARWTGREVFRVHVGLSIIPWLWATENTQSRLKIDFCISLWLHQSRTWVDQARNTTSKSMLSSTTFHGSCLSPRYGAWSAPTQSLNLNILVHSRLSLSLPSSHQADSQGQSVGPSMTDRKSK